MQYKYSEQKVQAYRKTKAEDWTEYSQRLMTFNFSTTECVDLL